MIRHIVLDTETTGLNPYKGDKIIEIGCIEMVDFQLTGKKFHCYINPEKDTMPQEAYRVHGLSIDFLKNYPTFREIASDFLEFIKDSKLIIHNAKFDMKFIKYEFEFIEKEFPFLEVIDTLTLAKKKIKAKSYTLNSLCQYFDIDISHREKHGALKDSMLLAKVFLNLEEQIQKTMNLLSSSIKEENKKEQENEKEYIQSFKRRKYTLSEEDRKKHISSLKDLSNPIWLDSIF